jgi:hypothetical protein
MSGQRLGGFSSLQMTWTPPARRTAFWATSASAWREVKCLRAQTCEEGKKKKERQPHTR